MVHIRRPAAPGANGRVAARRPRAAMLAALASAVLLALLAVTGCRDGGDEIDGPSATLLVTRDFGRELLTEERVALDADRAPLDLLRAARDVELTDAGQVVAVDGVPVDHRRRSTWALTVNGVGAGTDAGYRVSAGDIVQFDLQAEHDTAPLRAVVGAFPHPLTGGLAEESVAVRLSCSIGYHNPCTQVRARLRRLGVQLPGKSPSALRGDARYAQPVAVEPPAVRIEVIVGPWYRQRGAPARWIVRGPRHSGVFARMTADATALRLLDSSGRVVRTEEGAAGLVAAIRPRPSRIVWYVTGLSLEGVERAADSFAAGALRGAYAVAVTGRGVERLPLPPRQDP